MVSLGRPAFVGKEYLDEFSKKFNFSVLEAKDRAETKQLLPLDIEKNGPIDAFVIRMGTPPFEPFDEDLLGALTPECQIITSASAGFNEFDVEWMTRSGVYFCNTVDAVAEATADMAIFLTLATLRNTCNAEKSLKNGTWRGGLAPTRDPSNLTLGIVGMGAIGKVCQLPVPEPVHSLTSTQYLAKKALAFNMKIKYYNRNQLSPKLEERYEASYCSTLQELLACSDVVSINCPYNKDTEGLIGQSEFEAMKDGAYFINTARGPIVQEEALKAALESGKVTRAGLDVFCNEPNIDPWFLESDACIVQPHLGGLTDAAFQRAERECFENIRALFTIGVPNSPVNDLSSRRK